MTKLVISGLLLAFAGSVVSAAPAKEETAERVSYNDQDAPPESGDSWVELASPTPAKHGRTFITVEGRYAQLRVAAHAGRPVVKRVRVVYSDGKERVVRIAARQRSSVIDLPGAPEIDHIVVEANPRSSGTYVVHGAPPEATGVATR